MRDDFLPFWVGVQNFPPFFLKKAIFRKLPDNWAQKRNTK